MPLQLTIARAVVLAYTAGFALRLIPLMRRGMRRGMSLLHTQYWIAFSADAVAQHEELSLRSHMSPANEPYIPALGYHWLTGLYDPVVRLTTRESVFKPALVAQAALRAGDRVLDLACGTATLTLAAKRAQPAAELRSGPVCLDSF
jgi:hypothetical protein